jgi:hypothetical protein
MAQDDPWTELSQVDLDFVKQYWPRVFGVALSYEITKNLDIYKKVCCNHIVASVAYYTAQAKTLGLSKLDQG